MSRFRLLVAMIVILVAGPLARADGLVLRDEDGDVQVTVPKGWLPLKPDGWFRVVAFNEEHGGFVGILHKSKDDKVKDLKAFAEATFRADANQGRIRNSKMEGPKAVTVNGHPALQYAQTCQLGPKKLNYIILRTYIELAGSWNAVICWCPPDKVAGCAADFSQAVQSFREVAAPATAPAVEHSGI